MPYAPTVNDNSGQILAQGINQGVQGLAEGIQRSIQERKKKEEERRAKEAVNAAGKGLFGEDFDVKDAKPEQYSTIIGMAQERANKPLKDAQLAAAQAQQQNYALQMKNQQLEMDRQQRDDAALQAALGGIDAGGGQGPSVGMTESQMGMTGAQPVRGGVTASDAADVFATAARKGASGGALNQLSNIESHRAAAAENRAQAAQRGMPTPEFMPRVVDLGNGFKGMTTSRSSAVPLHDGKGAAPLTDVAKLMADRDAPGRTPEDRAKLEQAIEVTRAAYQDKPLSLNEFIMSPSLQAKFGDDYNNYRSYYAKQVAALQKAPAAAGAAAGPERVRVKLSDLK